LSKSYTDISEHLTDGMPELSATGKVKTMEHIGSKFKPPLNIHIYNGMTH